MNTHSLWNLFAGNGTSPYEADLSAMAMTIARAWDALLRAEFPDREFEVKVLHTSESGIVRSATPDEIP